MVDDGFGVDLSGDAAGALEGESIGEELGDRMVQSELFIIRFFGNIPGPLGFQGTDESGRTDFLDDFVAGGITETFGVSFGAGDDKAGFGDIRIELVITGAGRSRDIEIIGGGAALADVAAGTGTILVVGGAGASLATGLKYWRHCCISSCASE